MIYFSVFQKPYLNQWGVPRSQVALLSAFLLLPFIIKMFFAYLSDRIPFSLGLITGRRRPYMVLGLLLSIACFLLAMRVSPRDHFFLYSSLMFLASMSVSLFDAATDGLALDLTRLDHSSDVQSVMVAGKSLGAIILSWAIGNLMNNFGLGAVFFLLAIIYLLPLSLVLLLKEEKTNKVKEGPPVVSQGINRDGVFWMVGFYAILYSITSFGIDGTVTLFAQVKFSLMADSLGDIGLARSFGAIMGSFIAPKLLKQKYFLKAQLFSLIFLAMASFAWTMSAPGSFLEIKTMAVFWGVAFGIQEVSFLTLAMQTSLLTSSASKSTAFSFSLLMVLSNVGTSIGEGLTVMASEKWTFNQIYTILGLSLILPMLILFALSQTNKRYSFGRYFPQ